MGRQIPTAMVARNLERGSGFLHPRVDTAPHPNLFLVEPPLYAAAVVGLRRATGLALEPAGRLVSALATALAAWGLSGLVRRRAGSRTALLAVAALAVFPLTLRYGRAFQPDALMLGTLVAGVRCWDEHEAGGGAGWLLGGMGLLATGLALKIVSAYLLVPLAVLIRRPPQGVKRMLVLGLVLPALLWYAHAAVLLHAGVGSRASADNSAIWLRVLIPSALFRVETARDAARFLVLRGFTPLGLILALVGLWKADRLWKLWAAVAVLALAVLAGKLHHEYYWLALAPPAAVGVGHALELLWRQRPRVAGAVGCALVGLSLLQARNTWATPPEWANLPDAARVVRAVVPADALVVAPEALLYAADRRGCRLEFTRAAARRAAGEWEPDLKVDSPLSLVSYYQARGARFVAVPGAADEPSGAQQARLALQESIRRRYNVLVDGSLVLIAELDDPHGKGSPHGKRKQE